MKQHKSPSPSKFVLALCGLLLLACTRVLAGPVAPVAPGATVTLSGTTAIESPTTAGLVIRDELLPFEVHNSIGGVILTGKLQDRVIRNADGDMVFAPRLRELVNPGGAAWVTGVRVSGYEGVAVSAEYKTDGSGQEGPDRVTRSPGDGDELFFSHGVSIIVPPDEQRFVAIVTDESAFSLAGRFEIFASNDFGGTSFSTVIENTASPTPYYQVDPDDSIQAAIDRASPGDTIYVAAGTYNERIVLREGIDVVGEDPCTTTIDGGGSGTVVALTNLNDTEFAGFTVTGSGSGNGDAGIRIQGGRPWVNNNKITGNRDGIYTVSSNAAVCGNRMFDNTNVGIHLVKSSPLVTGNSVYRNAIGIRAEDEGSNNAQFINNTVDANSGDGILFVSCIPAIVNTISSNNGGAGIRATVAPPRSYNNVWNNSPNYVGASPGTGSFSADPLFDAVDPDSYALTAGSPCIDTGTPGPVYFDLDGTRADVGATGGSCGSAPIPEGGPRHSGFAFTSVGTIPTAEIGEGTSIGLAESGRYHDAPFGGTLWLYGGFGHADSAIVEYSIHIAKRVDDSTAPDPGDFVPVDDPLSKIRLDFVSGSYVPTRVQVGPDTFGGISYYKRTTNGSGRIWTHENVMVKFDSSGREGTYDIQLRAYDGTRTLIPLVENTITLKIDNNEPTAELLSISRSDGTPIPECAIIRLGDSMEDLQFRFNASHPNGYLHSYSLEALVGRDRHAGTLASDRYQDVHDDPGPLWPGVTNQLLSTHPALGWETCAYQFRLTATARTTNGFSRIYQDESFINYAIDPTSGLCTPDLDGDGDVDGDDLAIFAAAFGNN